MSIIYLFGGFFILMFIIRPIFNKIIKNGSNQNWDRILSDGNVDNIFKDEFKILEMTYIINTIMKPFGVNYIMFMSNLLLLKEEGQPSYLPVSKDRKYFSVYTPSIQEYKYRYNRPNMPIWFIAAFPDIVKWLSCNNNGLDSIMYEKRNENEIDKYYFGEGKNEINTLKLLINNYLKIVKPYLEISYKTKIL